MILVYPDHNFLTSVVKVRGECVDSQICVCGGGDVMEAQRGERRGAERRSEVGGESKQ